MATFDDIMSSKSPENRKLVLGIFPVLPHRLIPIFPHRLLPVFPHGALLCSLVGVLQSYIRVPELVFMVIFSSLHTSWQDSLPSRKWITEADIIDAMLLALGPLVSRGLLFLTFCTGWRTCLLFLESRSFSASSTLLQLRAEPNRLTHKKWGHHNKSYSL